jgi:hypothetical protein
MAEPPSHPQRLPRRSYAPRERYADKGASEASAHHVALALRPFFGDAARQWSKLGPTSLLPRPTQQRPSTRQRRRWRSGRGRTKKIGVWVPAIEPSVLHHHLWHQRPQRPRGVAAALVVLGCAPPN